MPDLDVSDMVEDPELADTFAVTRRSDVVDQKGRTTALPDEVFADVVGVVTQDEPAELLREPDLQRVPWRIFVASKFAFRGASDGNQPDVITWNGNDFTVSKVLPYSRFGDGVYEVVAQHTAATATADDNAAA